MSSLLGLDNISEDVRKREGGREGGSNALALRRVSNMLDIWINLASAGSKSFFDMN
jgi:hypothetical protein